jgi:hypothetical protein
MLGESKMACYEIRPKVKQIRRHVFDETPIDYGGAAFGFKYFLLAGRRLINKH